MTLRIMVVAISNRSLVQQGTTNVYACKYDAQGVGVHAVRKLVHSQGVSFLCDDTYKSIRYLCSYCSNAIPMAVAFRVMLQEQEASTTDVLT